nr:MAG TPA: hypothetical protein [Caudoviricetes sp.]
MIEGVSFNFVKLGYVMLQNADSGAPVKAGCFQGRDDAVSTFFSLMPVAGAKPQLNKLAVLLGVCQERQPELVGAGLSAPRRLILSQGWFGGSHLLLVVDSSSYFVNSAVHLNGICPMRPKRFLPIIHCASVGACLSGLYIPGR